MERASPKRPPSRYSKSEDSSSITHEREIVPISNLPSKTFLSQGAEGRVYVGSIYGIKCLIKERFIKKYRVLQLENKLTKRRILQEARNMTRVRKSGVHTPYLVLVDEINRNIYMQFITNSISVKLFLWNIFNSHKTFELKIVQTLAHEMGKTVAQIHNADVIHGDFTTSNFLLKPKDRFIDEIKGSSELAEEQIHEILCENLGMLYVIDFGLSHMSRLIEDKAVDLYVLKRAFISTHPGSEPIFEVILQAYKETAKKGQNIIERYKDVEKRGRKRLAFG